MLAPKPQESVRSPWRAGLNLGYAKQGEHTVPIQREHFGPLRILKGYRQSGPDCWEQVIVHPPGGIASCDELSINVAAQASAQVLLTTPGATKWYRAASQTKTSIEQRPDQHNSKSTHGDPPEPGGLQQVKIEIAPHASVEWLPLENIFYNGVNAFLDTRFDLAAGAALICADVTCLGRPASQAMFEQGRIRQRTRVLRAGKPLFIERISLNGQDRALTAPAGLNGHSCFGTLIAVPARATNRIHNEPDSALLDLAAQVRQVLAAQVPAGSAAVTALPDLLIVRWRGDSAEAGWHALRCAWRILREPLLARRPEAPRIWAC